jgi:hypothetical protein
MARITTRNPVPDWDDCAHWRGRGRAQAWPEFAATALAAAGVAAALIVGALAVLDAALSSIPGPRIVRAPDGWRAQGSRPAQISLACAQREPWLCATD